MEDKDVLEEEKKKKGVARGCAGCFKVVASAVAILFLTMYGYFYTQREGPYGFGPFTGVVLDAETKEPIKDAQISLHIFTDSILGVIFGPSKMHDYYSHTNSKGKYRIRKHVILKFHIVNSDIYFKIYKKGYIAYSNKRIFTVGERKDFKVKGNVVLLEKWDDEKFTLKDHSRHVGFMAGALSCKPKAKRFCEEAREEMILDCMYSNFKNPKSRKTCERIVNRRID